MKRLELVRIRVCKKCGRGGAELRSDDGETMVVALDPVRARELTGETPSDEVELLTTMCSRRSGATAGARRKWSST